ncbi:MAG: SpoIIE family protein phosphatase [Bdellovibrio sp.]
MKIFQSLKAKVYFTLISATSLYMIFYALLALHDFETDKVNYIFDSLRLQITTSIEVLRSELILYIDRMNNLELQNSGVIEKSSGLELIEVYAQKKENSPTNSVKLSSDYEGSDYTLLSTSTTLPALAPATLSPETKALLQEADKNQVAIRVLSLENRQWQMAIKFRSTSTGQQKFGVASIRGGRFFKLFEERQHKIYLLSQTKKILQTFEPPQAREAQKNDIAFSEFEKTGGSNKISGEHVRVYEATFNQRPHIVAESPIGVSDLRLIVLLPKDKSLEGVKLLKIKSVLVILGLFLTILAIGLLSSHYLTNSFRMLINATESISEGHFDIDLKIKSKDEIGKLAKSFLIMTAKIKDLLIQTADKARMEQELKTAKVVQSTLFPEESYVDDKIEIQGKFRSASECSGDWWFYFNTPDKLYVMIGDATGHGAGAALITSAVRSCVEMLALYPGMGISELMRNLNRGILAATKGTKVMTFFLGQLDLTSKEFQYINASHELPLFVDKNKPITRKTIRLLNQDLPYGPLGSNITTTYEVTKVQLQSGARIFFYTDGVFEIQDLNGVNFGERRVNNAFCKTMNEMTDLQTTRDHFDAILENYRQDKALADDVTYFFLEIK